jgi:hypothetical protein
MPSKTDLGKKLVLRGVSVLAKNDFRLILTGLWKAAWLDPF